MALEFRHLNESEIVRLAKLASSGEILPRLPHYEILFILEKIDELANTSQNADKLYFSLMRLKIQILKQVLREEVAGI